ncbi:MAG: 4-hydroxythreonine-4-phosphate dehydrogenase PdxA [Candidatus Omnitrophica bacterium]|nr:4-hydroxythreonine-4-phosphate dehydrogenase PdxA [Candidatus Omnitrophota bacterium]
MPISRSGRESTRLAITLGDPAGIGPEVTLKALRFLSRQKQTVQILLLGRAAFFRKLSKAMGLRFSFRDIEKLPEWRAPGPGIPCYFPYDFPKKVIRGRSDPLGTRLAVDSIALGVRLAMGSKIDAMVTPPIHKAGLKKAGYTMPGHTEYLAELSGTARFAMMLVGGPLRVVPVTRHVALKDVPSGLSKKKVEEAILLTDRELKESFGIPRPRLVVCGLNPHAGEEGNLGREEIRFIRPAVRSARRKTSSQIVGPLSPDSLFHDAYTGRYDAEICMYHDQGLIPLKMISRGSGVNVTLGLPFVRTSPDHGTGYDIAPDFKADPGSMIESIRLAERLSRNRQKYARSHPRN